jgi:hypothetical protein
MSPELHWTDPVAALVAAVVMIGSFSCIPEPARHRFSAIFVAGAGAAYLSGGLGVWEFAFTALATLCAYRGLDSYRFVGLAWVMHVVWDVLHHLYGDPIVWCAPTSSAQCAIMDSIFAGWYVAGAPSVFGRTS